MEWLKGNGNPHTPFVLERERYSDSRGYFEMIFEAEKIAKTAGVSLNILQVNLLGGKERALRGFHASPESANHWKFVTCVKGIVRDAVLDIRRDSPSFGHFEVIQMSEHDNITIAIPPGFAHGVQSVSEGSLTVYATNIPYRINNEFEINPVGKHFKGLWVETPVLSERDSKAPSWEEFASQ